MESIGPKVTGTVKERGHFRTYFINNRPINKVLNQDRLTPGLNGSSDFTSRLPSGGKKVRGTI